MVNLMEQSREHLLRECSVIQNIVPNVDVDKCSYGPFVYSISFTNACVCCISGVDILIVEYDVEI